MAKKSDNARTNASSKDKRPAYTPSYDWLRKSRVDFPTPKGDMPRNPLLVIREKRDNRESRTSETGSAERNRRGSV